MRVRSADDVFAEVRGNKFRDYPARAKSRGRLIPFAQPNIIGNPTLPEHPNTFLLGGCLSRLFERALTTAGFKVLSGRGALSFRHPSFEGPLVFNKPILGTAENELRWALEGAHDAGVPSLIDYEGELVDLQISPQFSHQPDLAVKLRRAFNATYDNVRDADLVMINLSRNSCWFDTETQLYLNDFSPERLAKKYPGRFEMHDHDVQDIKDGLLRVTNLIHTHTRKPTPPRIVLCTSPIGMRSGRSREDQLIADMESKAICRVAAAEFARENTNVDYGPIYEFAMLTDRSMVFSDSILDHIEADCAERFLGEYLAKNGADPAAASYLSTRGKASGYHKANEPLLTIDAIELHFRAHGYDSKLGLQYAVALQRTGRRDDAFEAFLRHAASDASNASRSLVLAYTAATAGSKTEQMEKCLKLAQSSEDPEVRSLIAGWQDKLVQTRAALAKRDETVTRIKALTAKLLEDPTALEIELADEALNPATPAKVKWLYAQALLRTRDDAAAPFLYGMLIDKSPLSGQAGGKLLTLVRKAGGRIGDITDKEVLGLLVQRQMEQDGGR